MPPDLQVPATVAIELYRDMPHTVATGWLPPNIPQYALGNQLVQILSTNSFNLHTGKWILHNSLSLLKHVDMLVGKRSSIASCVY